MFAKAYRFLITLRSLTFMYRKRKQIVPTWNETVICGALKEEFRIEEVKRCV